MPRVFTEQLYDLPRGVDVLDPELWERLDSLIEPYVPAGHEQPLYFATDNRGQYDAPTLADLREGIERQEEPPNTIRLTLRTGGYFVNVYTSDNIGSGGRVESEDEAFVNHVATRIRELFSLAAKRAAAAATGPAPAWHPVRVRSGRLDFLRDVSVQAIGGALAVGIVAVAVAVWAIFFR